jgi:hypothetical protein
MQKIPYSGLQKYLANRKGQLTFARLDAHVQSEALLRLNELYEFIWFWKQWGFSGDRMQFTTVGPYTTGTVSGSAGSRTLTGSSTSWPTHVSGVPLRGQVIMLNGKPYRVAYRASTTSIILEAPLTEDIAAGSAYTIYFVMYPLRWDIAGIRSAKFDIGNPLAQMPEAMTPIDEMAGEPDILYRFLQHRYRYDCSEFQCCNILRCHS